MANEQKKRVFFLCIANSCRNQMAQGWAEHLRDEEIDAYSAGLMPSRLSSCAVAVSINASISFVNAARGKKLIAIARQAAENPKITTYHIDITDEQDDVVAVFEGTAYKKTLLCAMSCETKSAVSGFSR